MIWDYVLELGRRIVWMGRNMHIIGLRVSKSLIIPAIYSVVSNLVLDSFLSSSLFHVTDTRKYLEPNKVKFILEKTGGYPQQNQFFCFLLALFNIFIFSVTLKVMLRNP